MTIGPTRIAALALAALALAACAGAPTALDGPTATTAPSSSAAATPASGAAWTVNDASKATVRVREQLVGVNAPSDAVLTVTGAKGSFTVNADGTFTSDSQISFALSTLKSDQSQRDGFIKQDTLRVSQFPTATFVPVKATGLTVPLPASGTFTFTLGGKLTIHGVTKDVTFDVQAKRDGAGLTAAATVDPTLKFEDFGMTAPSVPFRVVSVVDEIRLTVDLVATGPAS